MMVPNKLLDTILQQSSSRYPSVSVPAEDIGAVQKWALEGIAKRKALAEEAKLANVGS